jgi:raffinose/stachyose/melibiose transport system permease protein
MAGSKTVSLHSTRKRSVRIAATFFLLPALTILVVYIVYPILFSFFNSTMLWSGMGAGKFFTGLDNWNNLIKDINFWKAFLNNLKLMFLSLLFQVPLALALATYLNITEKEGYIFKIIWFIPYLLSSVVIGVLFKFALDANYGIFASISKHFGGGAVDLLGNPKTALYTVIGITCWQYTPFYMVLYFAAYGTIPEQLFEAASIEGASRGQYFWNISLPLLWPTVASGITLSIIGSLKYFDLIYVMTGGGPGVATELMATYMYKYSFVRFNMGYGSTIASGMFILITLSALITITLINRKTEL